MGSRTMMLEVIIAHNAPFMLKVTYEMNSVEPKCCSFCYIELTSIKFQTKTDRRFKNCLVYFVYVEGEKCL